MRHLLFYAFGMCLLVVSGCKCDDDNDPMEVPISVSVSFIADGTPFNFESLGGNVNTFSNSGSFSSFCIYTFGSRIFDENTPSLSPQFEMVFNNFYVSPNCDIEDRFVTLFSEGEASYSNGNNSGIIISFLDTDGVEFRSDAGAQVASTFSVTHVHYFSSRPELGPGQFALLSGSFSCMLYDPANVMESIALEEGTFSILVSSIF